MPLENDVLTGEYQRKQLEELKKLMNIIGLAIHIMEKKGASKEDLDEMNELMNTKTLGEMTYISREALKKEMEDFGMVHKTEELD